MLAVSLLLLPASCKNPDEAPTVTPPGGGGGGGNGGGGGQLPGGPPEVQVFFVDYAFRNAALTDAPHDFDPIPDLVRSSKLSIDIAIERINNQDFVNLLLSKANDPQTPVPIRIITERAYLQNPNYAPYYEQLQDPAVNGNNIFVHADTEGEPRMMHSRFMVIDNAKVVLGTYPFEAAGARSTIGDVVVISRGDVAAAVTDQFVQMFEEGKFGIQKSERTPHFFPLSDGQSAVEVYFGPIDNLRDRYIAGMESASAIAFAVKEFTDLGFDSLLRYILLQWAPENNFFGIINDFTLEAFSPNATSESDIVYRELRENIDGDIDGVPEPWDAQRPNSTLNGTVAYANNTINHKYIYSPNLGAGVAGVMTGSMNWAQLAFEQNDEIMIVLRGEPLAQLYRGRAVFLTNTGYALNVTRTTEPTEFGETFSNWTAYLVDFDPDTRALRNRGFGLIYGYLIGANTQQTVDDQVNIFFTYSGTSFLGYPIVPQQLEFDDDPITNPEGTYAFLVPAGQILISSTVASGSSTRTYNIPARQFNIGPGGIRRINMTLQSTTFTAQSGGNAGGGGGGSGGGGGGSGGGSGGTG